MPNTMMPEEKWVKRPCSCVFCVDYHSGCTNMIVTRDYSQLKDLVGNRFPLYDTGGKL